MSGAMSGTQWMMESNIKILAMHASGKQMANCLTSFLLSPF